MARAVDVPATPPGTRGRALLGGELPSVEILPSPQDQFRRRVDPRIRMVAIDVAQPSDQRGWLFRAQRLFRVFGQRLDQGPPLGGDRVEKVVVLLADQPAPRRGRRAALVE